MNPALFGTAQADESEMLHAAQKFAPNAKRIIYLFMAGGPSHIDLFDFKPALRDLHGTELPDSVRQGQRLTGMSSGQKSFPCVAPMFDFAQYGERQTWISELLPHTASICEDITIVRSMHTEAVNHGPGDYLYQHRFAAAGKTQPGFLAELWSGQ